MNGPIKMYKAKQIVQHDFTVDLPNCMYKLKNIHSSRKDVLPPKADNRDIGIDHVAPSKEKLDIFGQVKQFLKNNQQPSDMTELEARQNKILQQLSELKQQIFSIKSDLKVTIKTTGLTANNQTCLVSPSSKKLVDHPEIVINASPANPPYSLEVIQKLLKDSLGLAVTSYIHSSVLSLTDQAKQLQSSLVSFKPNLGVPVIYIRLIWKNVDSQTELVISQTPIVGEVNLLRYFARVTNTKLSYDSEPDSVEINSILDLCYLLVKSKTKTERTGILQAFNKFLGKSQFLNGRNHISVADVAAYSAIKQCNISSEISVNLAKWYQRCEVIIV